MVPIMYLIYPFLYIVNRSGSSVTPRDVSASFSLVRRPSKTSSSVLKCTYDSYSSFRAAFVQVCIYANVTSSSSESHMTSTKKSLGFPMARRKDCLEAGLSRRSARDGDEARGCSSESLLPRRPETKVGRDWALSSLGNSSSSCLSTGAPSSCLFGSDSFPPASLWSSLQCDPVLRLPVDKSQTMVL